MAKEMRTSEIEEFLDGPLVAWLSSCQEGTPNAEKLTYDEIIDGVCMHRVLLQMEIHCQEGDVVSPAGDASLRARNLKKILSIIRLFYEGELNHVVIRLPDVSRLSREPHLHVSEAQLLLKLLLGCAVNCPRKQHFVEKIKTLEEEAQLAIVKFIKKDLLAPGIMLSEEMLQTLMSDADSVAKVFEIVRYLCRARDYYKMKLKNLSRAGVNQDLTMQVNSEEDELEALSCSEVQDILDSSMRSETEESRRKDAEQLKEMSSRLRKQQEELIRKDEDLREARCQIIDMRSEKERLVSELKSARKYRDELDAANEKADRTDLLEQEIARLQEKLAKVDSYKSSLKELREKYEMLTESNKSLHEELETYKLKANQVSELKQQIFQLKQQMEEENASSRQKYLELCEENAQLEQLVKSSSTKESLLENSFFMDSSYDTSINMDNSLFEQLNNSVQSQTLKLELENRRLSNLLDSIKENSVTEESSKLADVQKENESLREKMRKLGKKCSEQKLMLELVNIEKPRLKAEKEILLKSKEKLAGELDQLKTDHDQLKTVHDQLNTEHQQSIKSLEMKIKLLEKECAQLKSDETRVEHAELQEDFRRLFKSNEKLWRDYKRAKTELSKRLNLESELHEKNQKIVELDLQLSKLQEAHSALRQNNRSTMRYNTDLLKQVHQLVMQAHQDREKFHNEERKNNDQVNKLKRQKEKLEEKIMDQYRRQDSTSAKKKKSSLMKETLVRVTRASSEFFLNRSNRRRSLGAGMTTIADESSSFDFEFTKGHETRSTCRESSFCAYNNIPRNRKSVDFLEGFEPSNFSFEETKTRSPKSLDFAEICSLEKIEDEEDLDKTLSAHDTTNAEYFETSMMRESEKVEDKTLCDSKQDVWMGRGCAV